MGPPDGWALDGKGARGVGWAIAGLVGREPGVRFDDSEAGCPGVAVLRARGGAGWGPWRRHVPSWSVCVCCCLLQGFRLVWVTYYPAEAKLFTRPPREEQL